MADEDRCSICDEIIISKVNGLDFCRICWGMILKQAKDEGIEPDSIQAVWFNPRTEELVINRWRKEAK